MQSVDERPKERASGDYTDTAMNEVSNQPSGAAALRLCATKSGKTDKQIAAAIGVDNAVWSRMKSGQTHPSAEQLDALMTFCGNEIPLQYLLVIRGYDPTSPRRKETDLERENRELRQQIADRDLRREIEMAAVRDLLAGRTL